MYFTYILKSKLSGRKYIGYCRDINERLVRHNQGREKSTKSDLPWVLLYKESFETRSEAVKRERQLKSYKSGEALKKLISVG